MKKGSAVLVLPNYILCCIDEVCVDDDDAFMIYFDNTTHRVKGKDLIQVEFPIYSIGTKVEILVDQKINKWEFCQVTNVDAKNEQYQVKSLSLEKKIKKTI